VKRTLTDSARLEPVVISANLEPLLPTVRRAAAPILLLTVTNGAFLFGTPQLAAIWYAWPIKPAISAAFMGTGYIIGMVGIVLTLFVVKSWRSVLIAVNGFFVLSALHVLVTLMHAERFRWDYPLTWAWIVVYSLIPIGILASHRHQRRAFPNRIPRAPHPLEDDWFDDLRGVLLVLGSGVLVVSAALFFAPLEVNTFWLWTLTPLTARITSSWYVFMALLFILSALVARRPNEVLLPAIMLGVWSALLLSLPILHGTQIRSGLEVIAWQVVHGVLLLVSLTAGARAWKQLRLERQGW
jgi:hypothetical protein